MFRGDYNFDWLCNLRISRLIVPLKIVGCVSQTTVKFSSTKLRIKFSKKAIHVIR